MERVKVEVQYCDSLKVRFNVRVRVGVRIRFCFEIRTNRVRCWVKLIWL